MRCNQCSYTMPYTASDDRNCPSCPTGSLEVTAEDWLSEPEMGLAKEIRPGQIRLAKIVEDAVNHEEPQVVIAQGGCGIGKSLGYLVPSLLTGRRVIVSTAKKSLQGQLATKDLPCLAEHTGRPRTHVSIKGQSNYLCRLFLRKKKEELFAQEDALYQNLERFLAKNPWGDLDMFPGGTRYPTKACTATECVGRKCSHATDCGYQKAKARAKTDHVVVTNHSLLGFDLKFGPQKLLGEYDILIIDEAHAAEKDFRNAFSHQISMNWMKRIIREMHKQNIALPLDLDEDAKRAWKDIFARVPKQDTLPCGFFGNLTKVNDALKELTRSIDEHVKTYWPELHDVEMSDAERAREILDEVDPEDRNEMLICGKLAQKITDMQGALQATKDPDDNMVRVRKKSQKPGEFVVDIKPINIGRLVGPKLREIKTVVLTSATLQPDLIEHALGIKADVQVNEPSPFDYQANGLVYIPKTVPNPKTTEEKGNYDEWVEEISREITQLVEASNGNALVLFTSIKEMVAVLNFIDENYELDQPILAQEAGRRPDEVFAEFMATDNAVLFGSKSFFEGIDVQGEKLRLVILTKLPFPIWGEAIVQAKRRQIGQSFFSQYYLPQMFVDLMQAAGRLIRTKTDRGVFAILDVRMWVGGNKKVDPAHIRIQNGQWKGYGSQAFQQLPFTNVTPNFALVQKFLKHIRSQSE